MGKMRPWERAIQLDIKAEKLFPGRRLRCRFAAALSEHTQIEVNEDALGQEVEGKQLMWCRVIRAAHQT